MPKYTQLPQHSRTVFSQVLDNGYWIDTVRLFPAPLLSTVFFWGCSPATPGLVYAFETAVCATDGKGKILSGYFDLTRYTTEEDALFGHSRLVDFWGHQPSCIPYQGLPLD